MKDNISKEILRVLEEKNEPLGTRDIEKAVIKKIHTATRAKITYRLMLLIAEGKICGKNLISGEGKGIWVWWKRNAFRN